MDYCSSCHRHLNGALVCPGCGDVAPNIAPVTADGRTVPTPVGMPATTGAAVSEAAAWEFTASNTWHDGHLYEEAAVGAGMDEAPPTGPSGGFEGATPAPQGRAARRRQMALWKKKQRRAVVATAVALVGGGLSVAAMDRPTADRAQAAAAPEDTSIGAAEEQAADHTRPAETRPDAHRSLTTPPPRSTAANPPRRQSVAVAPRTMPKTEPDAAAPPRSTMTPTPQHPAASPPSDGAAPDRTRTAPERKSAPTATDDTDSGTSQASPAPTTTSPPQLCLLTVCLG